MDSPIIYWCRQDLRVEDNPALKAALSRPGGVLPIYIYPQVPSIGAASRWWLHYALGFSTNTCKKRAIVCAQARGGFGCFTSFNS